MMFIATAAHAETWVSLEGTYAKNTQVSVDKDSWNHTTDTILVRFKAPGDADMKVSLSFDCWRHRWRDETNTPSDWQSVTLESINYDLFQYVCAEKRAKGIGRPQ